jgi:hypothetical protein
MRFNDFTHSATLVTRAHEACHAYLDELAAGRRPPSPIDRLPAAVTAPTPAVPVVPTAAAAVPARLNGNGNGNGNGAHPNGDHPEGQDGEESADRLAGVRRWTRATRLRRLTDRPLRRTPTPAADDPASN